jgi:hypothetical protein
VIFFVYFTIYYNDNDLGVAPEKGMWIDMAINALTLARGNRDPVTAKSRWAHRSLLARASKAVVPARLC